MILKHLNKILALIGIALLILMLWKSFYANEPYNIVQIRNVNNITNQTNLEFIDTTLAVGLDIAGISGVNVIIKELTPQVRHNFQKNNVNVELYAAIIGTRSQFILYVRDMNRTDAIGTIAHEVIHLMQYHSGRLVIFPPKEIIWEGDTLTPDDIYNIPYSNRPWEREAFDGEDGLSDKMYEILYGKNM